MPVRPLDEAFGAEVVRRFRAMPTDRKPAWGVLTAQDIVPHLIGTVKYSMGELGQMGFYGNWFTQHILPRIVYATGVPPPKNLKSLDSKGEPTEAIAVPGDCDTLQGYIDAFVEGARKGSFTAARHPFFGHIGPTGWGKIHVVHFKHHMKQFQV